MRDGGDWLQMNPAVTSLSLSVCVSQVSAVLCSCTSGAIYELVDVQQAQHVGAQCSVTVGGDWVHVTC